MPVAAASLRTVEIVVPGIAAGEGSNPQACVNVFHFRRTTVALAVDKNAVANAFMSTVAASMAAVLNNTWSLAELHVRMLEDITDPYFVKVLGPGSLVGAIAGDRLSAKQAAFLLLKTPYRGRSYRGSKHLGPMSESQCTAGSAELWNAGALVLLSAVAASIMSGFTDATPNTWVPVVYSRRQSDLTTVPATIQTFDLSQVLVNKRVGSMKSRTVRSVY